MAQVSQMRKLLASGWECHDSESERVATELEGATGDELSPEDLTALVHLAVHTIAEHLCDGARAVRVGTRLQSRVSAGAEP